MDGGKYYFEVWSDNNIHIIYDCHIFFFFFKQLTLVVIISGLFGHTQAWAQWEGIFSLHHIFGLKEKAIPIIQFHSIYLSDFPNIYLD